GPFRWDSPSHHRRADENLGSVKDQARLIRQGSSEARQIRGSSVLCRVMRDRSPPGDLRHPTADRVVKMQLAWRGPCTTLMSVTEIPRAANAYPARWLLRSDCDWGDLGRDGPTGF